jgi:hypothetical protein
LERIIIHFPDRFAGSSGRWWLRVDYILSLAKPRLDLKTKNSVEIIFAKMLEIFGSSLQLRLRKEHCINQVEMASDSKTDGPSSAAAAAAPAGKRFEVKKW